MSGYPILWHFSQEPGGHWIWRRLFADGTQDARSEPFSDYGACIVDALRNGFNPSRQDYSTSTGQHTTDYRHGDPFKGNHGE